MTETTSETPEPETPTAGPSVAERYRRVATRFSEAVAGVPAHRWADPSPCEGWDARDVVRHVVEAHGIFLGLVGREVGASPSVDDDPLAAWEVARDAVQADLDDPVRAAAEYDGMFGRSTFEAGVGQFVVGDVVVHTWDLARATGQDESIDVDELVRMEQAMRALPADAVRSPGVFGPEVDVPAGADAATRALAFFGRRA